MPAPLLPREHASSPRLRAPSRRPPRGAERLPQVRPRSSSTRSPAAGRNHHPRAPRARRRLCPRLRRQPLGRAGDLRGLQQRAFLRTDENSEFPWFRWTTWSPAGQGASSPRPPTWPNGSRSAAVPRACCSTLDFDSARTAGLATWSACPRPPCALGSRRTLSLHRRARPCATKRKPSLLRPGWTAPAPRPPRLRQPPLRIRSRGNLLSAGIAHTAFSCTAAAAAAGDIFGGRAPASSRTRTGEGTRGGPRHAKCSSTTAS